MRCVGHDRLACGLSVCQLVCPGWVGCFALLIRADVAVLCGFGLALPRSTPVQGVSRPPHTASRDCRNGSPLARANPCAPAPECGVTRQKETAGTGKPESRQKAGKTIQPRREKQPAFFVSDPTRSAASRAGMAGWAGEGGGRFGERREYEAPTLPSTHRQHGMARHQTRQPRNSSPPHTPGETRQRAKQKPARHHQSQPSPSRHHPSKPINPRNSHKTRLVKMGVAVHTQSMAQAAS